MNRLPVILVVDDESQNCEVLEEILLSQDYEVLMAANGIEALRRVEQHPPDLILMDIMMPEMDGLEVTRRLKSSEHFKIIPIVIISALGELDDRVKALDAGADDFLNKPVEKTELTARVKSLLKVKEYNDYMLNYQKILEDEVSKRTEMLKKSYEQIKNANLETIIRLSRAVEYRNDDTGDHIIRISYYSAVIAGKIGMMNEEIDILIHAAPMHDIGKIGIPDKILLKPGKLDAEEWKIMKNHCQIGAHILEGSQAEVIKMAEIIALTHHEKWDGTGYPKGLKGEDIPLIGRVVALADVFDALTSKRPYKEPISVSDSFSIIEQDRNKSFDPLLVDAFAAAKEEIKEIKEKYSNRQDFHYRDFLRKVPGNNLSQK